ncbi:HTH-type transcriptional regulator gltC [Delftia tsuruhatensis]|uniref:LysR substrate-binding domain-containing protein n=1 Tax=Delftia tsuruhatensis TaxID=180282 RepID=UPI001E744BB4|nr:LysR substrate-binding domain-containing protein [Delftia tsuruhatensis]CAB5714312.1 HTH-type transcriptional regulator gltC [Delftia tsuruhatensis]CAC9689000.1 HTH-type transcriptional regulator gltC [Delftia tsuruhatensis]
MELRQLRYLVAVIDAQSITRACDALHVVPSAVSHQLKLLEQELHSTLLVRGPLGVQPTATGRLLYGQAQAILRQVADARALVQVEESQVAGAVSVAIAGSIAQALAVPLLAACRERWPAVVLSLHEGLSGHLVEGVHSGRFDMAVLYASQATARLETQAVAREPFFFGCARALTSEGDGKPMPLPELARHLLLLPSLPNATRGALDRAFAPLDTGYQVAGEVNSTTTQVAAVLAGLGASVFPWISLRLLRPRRQLLIRPLDADRMYRDVVLAIKPEAVRSRAAMAVHDLVRELLRGLYGPLRTGL